MGDWRVGLNDEDSCSVAGLQLEPFRAEPKVEGKVAFDPVG